MDVLIDADCMHIPKNSRVLKTQKDAALNLFKSLLYPESAPPLADALRKLHGLKGDFVVVNPIHCQATHNDAVISAIGSTLTNTPEEAKQSFALLSAFFTEEEMNLHYHDDTTWLLSCDGAPSLNAKPTQMLLHQSLLPELKLLDKSMFWQKLFTACQMFCASNLKNSPINGVWFWAGDKLRAKDATALCADQSFYPLASTCSSNVTLYQPDLDLNKYAVFLLKDIHLLSPDHQAELSKKHAFWYWNNCAYELYKNNWLLRVWRKLKHAY